ncbi:MAG TPA: hypothetical protein VGZ25_02825 [Gemmataceae bacterium]|jgi:hypothetical protein|nr:hypothetical protein [Gemmataceae bacterium]
MSEPSATCTPVTLQPTRRQLDELDALLQRMLELPVLQGGNESEEVVSQLDYQTGSTFLDQEPPSSDQEPPSDHFWESVQPQVSPDRAEKAPVEEFFVPPQPIGPAWQTERIENTSSGLVPEPAQASYYTEPPISEVIINKSDEKSSDIFNEERAAWAVAPLLWVDDLFVIGTLRLGRLGFWLRGPSGRAFLGGLGLVGLGIAIAFTILDRMNWP